jgi:hypothetical protein
LYFVRGCDGFEIASLRQGDILEGVPFPLMDHEKIQILGSIAQDQDYNNVPPISSKTHQHRDDREWVTAVIPVRFGLCAILSNCCDLEPRNGRVQTLAISLARLRPIPIDIRNNPANFDSLKANKDPRDRENAGYIEYFYLESHPLLQNQDWRVQFNQVVSVPTTEINLLLRKKILQLDDRTRMKFKIKLGFTLMRANDDELEAGLENPWLEVPAGQLAQPAQVLQQLDGAPAPVVAPAEPGN